MRIRLATGNPVMIAGDYGGEPSDPSLSRTWFNRSLWDACGKSVKERKMLIAEVLTHEASPVPVRLGYREPLTFPPSRRSGET